MLFASDEPTQTDVDRTACGVVAPAKQEPLMVPVVRCLMPRLVFYAGSPSGPVPRWPGFSRWRCLLSA